MLQQEPFSSLAERWKEISDFPAYSISDWGRVRHDRYDRLIRPTRNTQGVVMVGLMQGSRQYKRSLPLLVAGAFLPPPVEPHSGNLRVTFDTPIHLNGDREDNHYANLMWRPLWFARKYMRQFSDDHLTFNDPIQDVETGEVYKNSMHAATTLGLLDYEIYMSMINNNYVWPTGQIFREAI